MIVYEAHSPFTLVVFCSLPNWRQKGGHDLTRDKCKCEGATVHSMDS